MKHNIYLLASMTQPGFWDGLTIREQESVTRYLEDMNRGTVDGEMDIERRENSRGYYTHLEILESLKNENEQSVRDYTSALQIDIAAWLALKPGHHEVLTVREFLD
ncbi:MAG: hypothetical protein RJQ07_02855 [Pseudomonadales bacterium]